LSSRQNLNRLLHLGLESRLLDNFACLGICDRLPTVLVQFQQLVTIQLWPLEDLDLQGVDLLHGVDASALLLDVEGQRVSDQLLDELPGAAVADLASDDLGHSLADLANLSGLGIAGLLVGLCSVSESDDTNTDDVTVGGLDIGVALDQGLPLLDNALQLVRGQAHSIKAGKAVLSLHIVTDEPELTEAPFGTSFALQISEGDLEDAALKPIRGNLGTLCAVHKGLANVTDLKACRGLDVVPVLAGEGIDDLLLGTLLATDL